MRQIEPETLEKIRVADALMEQVGRLMESGRYREALPICERVHKELPHRADALQTLGVIYSRLGDSYRALESLAESLLVDANNPRTLYYLAEVYLQTGSPVHAMRSLRRLADHWAGDTALRDIPDPRPLVEQLDQTMVQEIGLAGMTREYQEVAMMAAERGRLRLLFQSDTKKAAAEFRIAIKTAPHYPQARNNLSLTYFIDGQPELAMNTLLEVLQMHPDNVFALATLAFYRYVGGDPAEACLPLAHRAATLVEAAPRRPDVLKVAEVLSILGDDAGCEAVLGMIPSAQPLLASKVDSSESTRLALLAAAVANQGRADEALDLLRSEAVTFHDTFARRLLSAIDAGEKPHGADRYPGISWDGFVSPVVLARLGTPEQKGSGLRALSGSRAPRPQSLPQTLAKLYPRLVDACALMLWVGDKTSEELAITLLSILDTPPAVELLRQHMYGTLGSYSGRHDAAYALLDGGHLENSTVLRFWLGTDWGEVQIFRLQPRPRNLNALSTKLHTLAAKETGEATT